jgi:serine/threonine-protein kinase
MIGEIIGAYRITAKLGEGGMGSVWLGQHTVIGRKAAIKLLRPEISREKEMVTRFFNEARASALIEHPGIVDVFDFGTNASGSAYLVMEFLHGESLRARIAKVAPMPEAAAIRITRQAASALAVAHAKGIVHRDLKPDNLYLVPDEAAGGERVKVLDFGIAKLTGESGGTVKTETGSMMGSPAYMSPEQCKGAGSVDERADVYSLGCVLYEMVTGRIPFAAQGVGEMIGKHIYEAPRAPRTIVPSISTELDALILATLAKDPADRLRSMNAFARALDQIAGTPGPSEARKAEAARAPALIVETVRSPAPTLPTSTTLGLATGSSIVEPTRPRRRRTLWLALGGTAVIAVGGVIAFGGGASKHDGPAPRPASAPAITVDAGVRLAAMQPIDAALSMPDATRTAIVAIDAGVARRPAVATPSLHQDPPKKPPKGEPVDD